MDEIDIAERREQQYRDLAINAIRQRPVDVVLTFVCLNCNAPLPLPAHPARRWCDGDCRDDWEARRRYE